MRINFWKVIDKGFINLLERSWKHEAFWKGYYKVVLIGVVVGYIGLIIYGIMEEAT